MAKKIIIIGTGLGALATALRLSNQGHEITMLEKYDTPGGRLNIIKKDGFEFDMGPSFFSMSYEFKELFDSCGIKMPFELEELNPVYSVNFSNGKKPFNIYKDFDKLAKEFEHLEKNFEQKIAKYIGEAGKIFHDTENIVIRNNFKSKLQYLFQLTRVPLKHSPKMFRSMWDELEKNFESEEAKVIFSLVAFFLGSTPFDTPAVYSLLNYTELVHDGYWNVKGGMYKITTSLVQLLLERKVKFVYNTEVTQLEKRNGKVSAAIDKDKNSYEADLFICNADAAAFRGKILGRKKYTQAKLDNMEWTLAPFTIYLGVKGKMDNLIHHNYFLGSNFKEYAHSIFKTAIAPEKPYYYVNVSSRTNPHCAPSGHENLFILCPVPDLRHKPQWDDANQLADNIINDLSQRCGYNITDNIVSKTILTPIEWQNQFNLYRGSGLGLAHGLNQVGGFRPSNKDEELKNLYYVGASTTPGTGLPMVVISSKLVVERIYQDELTSV
ncbi:MAG: Phytoene dehydrogenase [Bacteroidota bacterium]|jgi:phytoene desaturase